MIINLFRIRIFASRILAPTQMLSTVSIINEVSRYLNYFGAIPMMILGIVGAILTIVVFTTQVSFRNNTTINYLLANAILTGIHLPTIYAQSILVDGFLLGVFNSSNQACREHSYFLYVTTVTVISFPCWAAFDQYAATCREAKFRYQWNSLRIVRLAIVLTVVFWAIVYIPVIFLSGIVNNRCSFLNATYRKFMNYFLTPVVYTILPFAVIVFCTRGTIQNLRLRKSVHRDDHFIKSIRRMLIPQLMILCLSGFPFSIEVIYFELTNQIEKDSLRQAIEHLFIQIDRLFYHCNFVCNFYIYAYMSSEVRKALRQVIHRCFRWNQAASS